MIYKRPLLWASITLLFGLSAAAWGLVVDKPEFSRGGLALALAGAPLLLLIRPTYERNWWAVRVNVQLALAWTALGVLSFCLWRWAGDAVFANALAVVCGVHALQTIICAGIGWKYPELPPLYLKDVSESVKNKENAETPNLDSHRQ